jgi:hypothetical protein
MVPTATALRRGVLAILLLGTIGSGVELILLEHYEDPWQYLPLVLFAAAIVALLWNLFAANASSVRTLRALMALYVAAGLLGVGLHFRGAAEFQTEIDPGMARWALVKKSLHSKAPPVLAPGLMVQIGLLGLISTYRHPALSGAGPAVEG